MEYIKCPFCGEGDYDLIGLKHHLENSCDAYNNTMSVEEEAQLMKLKDRLESAND